MAGKSSAVADVAAQAGPIEGRSVSHTLAAPDGGDQADLLGFERELELFGDQTIAPPRRGPGRPPGSVNRSTTQLRKLLMAKGYRDPAEFLASLISMDARALAAHLSAPKTIGDAIVETTSVAAAVELQLKAARELMPYWHQKTPIQVQHEGEGQRMLVIIHDGPAAGARIVDAGEAMSIHDAHKIEQSQALSGDAPAPSHGDASHNGVNDE